MIRPVRSDWQRTLIVCGKCSKRIDGGFGKRGRTPLAKALRKALAIGRGRKARLGLVESRCLGVCPKNGVVVIDAAEPGRWRIIPEGTSIDAVIGTLNLR